MSDRKKLTRQMNAEKFFKKLELHEIFESTLITSNVYLEALKNRVFLSVSTNKHGLTFYEVMGALPREYELVNTSEVTLREERLETALQEVLEEAERFSEIRPQLIIDTTKKALKDQ